MLVPTLCCVRVLFLWCLIIWRHHKQVIVSSLEIPQGQEKTSFFPRSALHSSVVRTYEVIGVDRSKRPSTSKEVPFIPISRSPLLLFSSQPVATGEECNLLIDLFDAIVKEKEDLFHSELASTQERAWSILERIQNQIDEWLESPRHDGESPLPRYVTYEPSDPSYACPSTGDSIHTQVNVEIPSWSTTLLPDGLHVDTNNSQHFRHITVLLYLTTNTEGGATTFPLANASPASSSVQAAISLIQDGITHTQMANANPVLCKDLENAARQLYDVTTATTASSSSSSTGIRVLPQAGHVCAFFNLDGETGMPDPISFHGGEADLGQDDVKRKAL
jgi:hypothetical protein